MMNRSCLRLLAAASVAGCLMALAAPAQSARIAYNSNARTFGCDGVTDDPPEVFDFNPAKDTRYSIQAAARAPSGSRARVAGAAVLGRLAPLQLKTVAAELQPSCRSSAAEAAGVVSFADEIDVTAGDLPVGTPVTYTATLDLAVAMPRAGNGCTSLPFFRAYLNLSGPFTVWSPTAPFDGTYRMTISKTVAVGDRLSLVAEAMAAADASRIVDSPTFCADNRVRMTDAGRITLTADVPGANTTSVKGIRYGLPR